MYLPPHRIATRLAISEAAVRRMVDAGDIPFVRLPTGQVRFVPVEVHRWLLSLQHSPTTTIPLEDSTRCLT